MGGGYTVFAKPDPLAAIGLNSAFVFGANVLGACALNNTMVIGANQAFVINPVTAMTMLGATVPPALNALCGGSGGNLLFSVGVNNALTIGQQYTMDLGGNKDSLSKAPTNLTGVIPAAILICLAISVWMIAYGVDQDENQRANIVISCQVLVDALMMTLMLIIEGNRLAAADLKTTLKGLFFADPSVALTKDDIPGILGEGITYAAAIVEALITPAIEVAQDENHFAAQSS